jgi:hypothetical protein
MLSTATGSRVTVSWMATLGQYQSCRASHQCSGPRTATGWAWSRAARLIRIRSDLLSGVTQIIAAVALPLVFGA